MQEDDPIEDIIARARRAELTSAELHRLQVAIESSHENRLLYEAGRGFTSAGSGRADDDLLVARVADRVSRMTTRRGSKRRARTLGLVVASLSLASAAAAAGWVLEGRFVASKRELTLAAAASPLGSDLSGSARNARGPAGLDSGSAPAPDDGEFAEGDPAPPADPSAHASTSGSHAQHGDNPAPLTELPVAATPMAPNAESAAAAELYAEANRARRIGNTSRALELYRRLAERFPKAQQAEQSRLAAAELFLQRGEPSAALAAFRSCQGEAVAAEALWGAARALRALDRLAEEQQVLTQLRRQFPDSAYSEAARERLNP